MPTPTAFGRGPLTHAFPPDVVAAADLTAFHPYPTAADGDSWRTLPESRRESVRARFANARAEPWPHLPASSFAAFARTGDRIGFETLSFRRRTLVRDLTLGACLLIAEGDDAAAALDVVADAVWSITEETAWGVPAHERAGTVLPDPDAPTLDLFAAETGATLAWVDYLLGARLGDLGAPVRARIRREVGRRILDPLLATDWFWLGTDRDHVNNWNPWIASNVLTCAFVLDDDAERRARVVTRLLAGLDVYLASMPDDGGCTEGQSYWAVGTARLLDAAWQLREASGGRLDALGLQQIADGVRYPVAMHLGGRWMVQHADGPGRWAAEPVLLHRYARLVGDDDGVRLAVHLRDQPAAESARDALRLSETLMDLFEPGFHGAPPAQPPAVGAAWFSSIEVLVARERPGTNAGLLLAVKGGHNDEDHNQNDVGSFSVALDGVPCVIDAGVGTYDATTFGPDRYGLWTMRSGWHNLPVVNGVEQAPGRRFAARDVAVTGADDAAPVVEWSGEIAGAWPADAGLASWRRTLRLDRTSGTLTLSDAWRAPGLTRLELPLVCFPEPSVHGDVLVLGALQVDLGAAPGFDVAVERQPIPRGDRLEETWGEQVWRAVLTPRTVVADGAWTLTFRR